MSPEKNGTTAPKKSDVVSATTVGSGVALISPKSPLTRLNYFDGKFLRATDLFTEQAYYRKLVSFSNRSGTAGVVYGFDTKLEGDSIRLGSGLAVNGDGEVLLLVEDKVVAIDALLAASRKSEAQRTADRDHAEFDECETVIAPDRVDTTEGGSTFYLLVICPIEALCGEEDVYGRLCEEACVSATERPFRIDGVVLRAIPIELDLTSPFPVTTRHYRSLAASRYYSVERRAPSRECRISAAGLATDLWCRGALAAPGACVPLALLARSGTTTLFLDEWIARRERIEESPRRYWAWRMCMRPWNVFLAQVLQFQCQLHEVLEGTPDADEDPCAPQREAARETASLLAELARGRGGASFGVPLADPAGREPSGLAARLDAMRMKLESFSSAAPRRSSRVLIDGGILELPPAGYLPIDPQLRLSVNEQVRALLGDGLDLRFCVTRADYVPHAFEEAQHMDRISLLLGLDDPTRREAVDVLVPDGTIDRPEAGKDEFIHEAKVTFGGAGTMSLRSLSEQSIGAARDRLLETGGLAFAYAGVADAANETVADPVRVMALTRVPTGTAPATPPTPPAPDTAPRPVETRAFHLQPGFLESASAAVRTIRDADVLRRFVGERPAGAAAPTSVEGTAAGDELAAAAPPAAAVGGIWISFEIDRDLRDAAAGDVASLALRFTIATTGQDLAGADVQMSARFEVTANAEIAAGRRIQGKLTLDRRMYRLAGGVATPSTAAFQRTFGTAVLEYTGDSQSGSFQFTSTPNDATGPDLTATRTWRPDFTGSIEVSSHGVPILVELKSNDEVLKESNSFHVSADQALTVVGAALGETEFHDENARIVFAPLHRGDSAAVVRTTRDWVLFHRRRRKDCGVLPVAPPVEPMRRYYVFEITATSSTEAGELATRLLRGSSEELAALAARVRSEDKPHLTVDFEGGTTRMLTTPEAFAARWPIFTPGPTLAHAFICRPGGDLAQETARLAVVTAAIPAATSTSGVSASALATMPSAIEEPTADGSILFITVRAQTPPVEVRTECHRVFLVELGERTSGNAVRELEDVSRRSALDDVSRRLAELMRQMSITFMGALKFDQQSTVPDRGEVETIAQMFASTTPRGQKLIAYFTWTTNDALRDSHLEQGRVIATAVSAGVPRASTPREARISPSGVAIADNTTKCPSATFLIRGRS